MTINTVVVDLIPAQWNELFSYPCSGNKIPLNGAIYI